MFSPDRPATAAAAPGGPGGPRVGPDKTTGAVLHLVIEFMLQDPVVVYIKMWIGLRMTSKDTKRIRARFPQTPACIMKFTTGYVWRKLQVVGERSSAGNDNVNKCKWDAAQWRGGRMAEIIGMGSLAHN